MLPVICMMKTKGSEWANFTTTLIFILVLLLNKWYRSQKIGLDSQWSLIVTSKNFIQKQPFMSFWHGLQWFSSMWDIQILSEIHQSTVEAQISTTKKTSSQLHSWPITNSMEQRISWEDNHSSSTQEILTFYEIPMFITLTQNPTTCTCPQPDQTSPRTPSYFSRIHFNIILPSMPRFSLLFLSCWFPTKTLCVPLVCHAIYFPCQTHLISYRVYQQKNINIWPYTKE